MKYSKLFGKTLKTVPAEAEAISHKLLIKAGFIDKAVSAGIYSLLPLGWQVYQKIENIIREEMNKISGQEMFMPTLQPKRLWKETDRWANYDPPLFTLKDRHSKEFALGPTHEEIITDIVRRHINSYKDLPLALYHIQNKFRNEMRPTGGILRTREFVMKDLYSFHTNKEDLDKYYNKVLDAYLRIFDRCGLKVKVLEASGGTIGGDVTHEFSMLCPTGEDKILYCQKCDFAVNVEIFKGNKCKKCQAVLVEGRGIENGHIFKLETKYSKDMNAFFIGKDGKKKLVWMGCYGIGLQRLMATIVEGHHDKKGIIWPKSVSPFDCYLIGLQGSDEKVYKELIKAGVAVLWDEREVSAGQKFADADLIGIPVRLVISKKTKDKIEFRKRGDAKIELLTVKEVVDKLKKPQRIK